MAERLGVGDHVRVVRSAWNLPVGTQGRVRAVYAKTFPYPYAVITEPAEYDRFGSFGYLFAPEEIEKIGD